MSASMWRMRLAALYLTLVLDLPWMSSCVNTSGSKITCQAGKFEIGQPATVTCNFHKNLRESKTSFYVEARFFDSNIQRSVYSCNWLEDSRLKCVDVDGFVLRNDDATDHLTLDIREFAVNHAGAYRCLVIDDDIPTTEQCFLLSESRTGGHSDLAVVVGAVLLIAIILLFVVGILCVKKRNLLCWKKKHAPTNAEDDESAREPLSTHEQSEERNGDVANRFPPLKNNIPGYSTVNETHRIPDQARYKERKGDIIYAFPPLKDNIPEKSTTRETNPSQNQGQGSPTRPEPNAQSSNSQTKFNTGGMMRKPHEVKKGGLSRDPSFINQKNFPYKCY